MIDVSFAVETVRLVEPVVAPTMAEIVVEHLRSGEPHSTQYPMRCAGCTNPQCRNILHPIRIATARTT